MKRRVAIGFGAVLLALVGVSLVLARTEWAGRRLCAELAARLAAEGLPFEAQACRVHPLRLMIEARGVRLGPPGAPVLEAESLGFRLAPIQALGGKLELAEVWLERPRVAAAIPRPDPAKPPPRCPPELLSRIRVHELRISEGQVDLSLPDGGRIRAGRVDLRATPPGRSSLRALATRSPRSRLSLDLRAVELEMGGRSWRFDGAGAEADLALDLSAAAIARAWVEGAGARVEVRGAVGNLCNPSSVDLRVTAQAPLAALLAAAGKPIDAAGMASADVQVTGRPSSPSVEGEVALAGGRIDVYVPGDLKARFRYAGREVQVQRLEVAMAGGSVVAQGKLRLGREPTLEAEARLEGPEFGDILARFGLPGAWISFRSRGLVKASGTVWPLALAGTATADLADFRVLTHAWDRPRAGEKPVLEFPRGRVETRVEASPERIRLADARLRVGAEELLAQADLGLTQARGFSIEMAGGVDLSELGHVASVPMAGRAVLSGRLGAAPYGNPRVEASVRARDLRFLRLDLGEAGAEVSYGAGGGFTLRAARIEGRRGETRYAGEIAVDLGASPPALSGGRFEARGRLRDLFEGAMPWTPEARQARDAIDAPVEAEARVAGPSDRIGAEVAARLGPGKLLGRPFDSGRVAGRVEEGRRAVFDQAELRRGSGMASASGTIGLAAPFPWELETSASGLALEDLGLPGGRWEGSTSAQASLAGSFEEPELRFSASGEGVTALGIPLGAIQVGGTLRRGELVVTGSTEGLKLAAQSRTSGGMPFEARLEVDADDATRFLPGAPSGLRAKVRGEAVARGLLADLGAARSEIAISDLQAGYADFRVQNRGPVLVATGDRRLEVRSFTLVGTNTELSVSGAREADGKLSFATEGSLDLRLLGGLIPAVTRPGGRLRLEAHVSGTSAEPLLVGTGHLRDVGFQLRDLPLVFSGIGGDLAFSQNRVIFDRLPGLVNGGRAEFAGEVELARFLPAKVRAQARFEEVPLRVPATLPSVVSGQLALAGTWDSMLLSGRVDVARALYAERVDLEKSLLEFRRRTSAAGSFDKSGEWLRLDVTLALGGDIRIDNDLVRGGVRGELTLSGTLASPGLVGTLSMTPGSIATYRSHDFLLTHAVVDLVERRRIRAQLDVHGEAQVRDYKVLVHAFGPTEDLQVQLTSQPSLTQEDIVTLLSLGVTSRDTAATGGMGGAATAAVGQALFSASGLDEQVKRWLPRGGVVRDFTMRITSAYSESSGQVVPKAEFESKLGEDFRLRYQAPISGGTQGKGQRAELEWRIDQRSRVQPALQLVWDNDNPDVATNIGGDVRFRLEWSD